MDAHTCANNFNLLIFCAGSFSKEFETDSDAICQLVNNSCLQTCLKKGNFYLSRPRHSVLIESEFLPVTNLTLSLLSVSPDTFVRQRMKWNFNDHLSKKSLYLCLLQVSDRFPDLDSLVAAKLLLPHEAERLQRVDFRTPHEATWTPILWALKLVCKARWEENLTTVKITIEF